MIDYFSLAKYAAILTVTAGLFGYTYHSGYANAMMQAETAQAIVVQTANAAIILKNAEVAKINENFAQLTQKLELKNHEYKSTIDSQRDAIAHANQRLRDPYAIPASSCKLSRNTAAASDTTNSPAPSELSEQLTEFLENQAYAADQVAVYARTCHDFALSLSSAPP